MNGRAAAALAALLLLAPAAARAVPFTFDVPHDGRTSAGVFTRDGTLVRTLWSGVSFTAGRHAGDWDGIDDRGRLMPAGRYEVRVVSSRAKYVWEGVLGNTSDDWSGPGVFHFMTTIGGMAIAGKTAFIAAGYNEGGTAQARFSTDAPGKKTSILATGAQFWKVATDGVRVYWAGDDPAVGGDGFVVATRVADDGEVVFDARHGRRRATRYGMAYASAIDVVEGPRATPTGIAVQRRGPFLFVARAGMNSVHVLDKLTGRPVHAYALERPGDLAVDADDGLWIIHTVRGARVVQRMAVDAEGFLTRGRVLHGPDEPLALGANRAVLVADGGGSQQVKAYDAVTGAPLWTLGEAGGYARDPRVTDQRFDFQPGLAYTGTPFVALQPDGAFWVGDPGCYRSQRYAADRTFVDAVAYVPASYSAAADPNAPTRVFASYLELAVDYALALGPRNGSWRLARNWRASAPLAFDNQYGRLRYVTTLKNGRTYATLHGRIVELPAEGPMRDTGQTLPGTSLYADGSVRSIAVHDGVETWTARPLTGFDERGDPRWGEARVVARAPLDAQTPYDDGDPNALRAGVRTSSGVYVSFDFQVPGYPRGFHAGWHLGGVKEGARDWAWLASPSTWAGYRGPFPTDGTFDISNSVGNAGGSVFAIGRHVIYGYRGENWRGRQTNKWRHYLDDGLFVDEFGVVGVETRGEAPPELAGNALNAWPVTLPDGRSFLYHNDEGTHGGVHRWRLEDLDSTTERKVAIRWDGKPRRAAARKAGAAVDLLQGLQWGSSLGGGAQGWTVDPAPDRDWFVATNRLSAKREPPFELGATFEKNERGARASVTRELPASPGPLRRWSLEARVAYDDNYANHGEDGGQYLEVLDAQGRVIARFHPTQVAYPDDARVYGNRAVLVKVPFGPRWWSLTYAWQPLAISVEDGRVSFRYADLAPVTTEPLDPGADWQHPARLRLSFWNTSAAYRRAVDLDALTFRGER
jgi:hypothetical protein